MAEKSLKKTTQVGIVWSTIDRFGQYSIGFIFNIILARLLSPEVYGIVAMPYIFLLLAQVFVDSGFSKALIRKSEVTEYDLSTAFYFNLFIGVICYIILFFSSPYISHFYNTPILENLLKVSALPVLFSPLCSVHQTILTRNIDFKKQTKISVSSQTISGIIGLWMAFNGYGVWALVVSQSAAAALRVALFWTLSRWWPKTGWSNKSFKYLWNFGSRMLASAILAVISENLGSMLIGKVFNSKDLGNYTRARQFGELPSSTLTGVLQRVTFPVLSKIQDEQDRLAINYRKIIRLSAFIIFPIMTGLAGVAYPFVKIVLGDQWLGCVLLLQLMCFNMMWYPIHAVNLNLLEVKGRSDLFFKIEVIKQTFCISVTLSVVWFGVYWLAAMSIISSLVCLAFNTYYTGKFINVGFITQIKDLLRTTIISLIMFCIIHLFCFIVENSYAQLCCGVLLGVVSYILLSYKFNTIDFEEFLTFLPNSLKKKYNFK